MQAPFNTQASQFKTEPLANGLYMVKHVATGDALVYGPGVGISADQAEYWKRNYTLPVVGTLNTRFLPTDGGQVDIRRVNFEDFKNVRLLSYLNSEEYEAVVSTLHGKKIQFCDDFLKLGIGRSMLLARYSGPRIEEGERELPAGGRMDFFLVRLMMEYTPELEQPV